MKGAMERQERYLFLRRRDVVERGRSTEIEVPTWEAVISMLALESVKRGWSSERRFQVHGLGCKNGADRSQ